MKPMFLLLGNVGGMELILVLSVILIFFGAKRIPELARGLGKGIREFKDASSGVRREIEDGINTQADEPKDRRP
jgi:sec-independent protein translocase protein TatA